MIMITAKLTVIAQWKQIKPTASEAKAQKVKLSYVKVYNPSKGKIGKVYGKWSKARKIKVR